MSGGPKAVVKRNSLNQLYAMAFEPCIISVEDQEGTVHETFAVGTDLVDEGDSKVEKLSNSMWGDVYIRIDDDEPILSACTRKRPIEHVYRQHAANRLLSGFDIFDYDNGNSVSFFLHRDDFNEPTMPTQDGFVGVGGRYLVAIGMPKVVFGRLVSNLEREFSCRIEVDLYAIGEDEEVASRNLSSAAEWVQARYEDLNPKNKYASFYRWVSLDDSVTFETSEVEAIAQSESGTVVAYARTVGISYQGIQSICEDD